MRVHKIVQAIKEGRMKVRCLWAEGRGGGGVCMCVCTGSTYYLNTHSRTYTQVRLPGQAPDAEEEEKKQRQLYYLLWKDEEETEEERRRRKVGSVGG